MRDGFHVDSDGGRVLLQSDGTPVLDYPLNAYFWDGARRALATMAEIQFAAGATQSDGTASLGGESKSCASGAVPCASSPR